MAFLTLRTERLLARLRKTVAEIRGKTGQVYVQDRIAEYRNMWKAIAEQAGASFTEISNEIWEIELDGGKTRVMNDILEFDNFVILEMAGMKPLIYSMLGSKGLSVPEHSVFGLEQVQEAYQFLDRHPNGCVIKPANGTSSGVGVTTHIRSRKEARKAAILASLYGSQLLIEPMIPGECYRLLVLEGKMIHAVSRRGLSLNGDGQSSIAVLISNEDRKRAKAGEANIDIDADCRFTLGYQNMKLDSIPESGQELLIKSVNDSDRSRVEVRTVYNQTVTDRVCDSIKQNAEDAAKILGSDLVGVDFITRDITVPLEQSGGVINELNTTPGLHHHYDIKSEKYPKPSAMILKALLRNQ